MRRSNPGSTPARYSFTGAPIRRHDSTTERIAATFGPAFTLPTCSQFFRPSATGRMEFSARLLDSSTSSYSRQRTSLGHLLGVYAPALPNALLGSASFDSM